MNDRPGPPIAVLPDGPRTFLAPAVEAGGGEVSDPCDAEALVWAAIGDSDGLASVLDGNPQLRWVQLPWAGVEPYVDVIRAHAELIWTCAKGVYAEPVAEHALALALAGRRNLGRYSRAGLDQAVGSATCSGPGSRSRRGRHRRVAAAAAGPVRLRRHGGPPQPAADGGRPGWWGPTAWTRRSTGAEVVVLALALVPETEGIIDARRLALLAPDATLVNVARAPRGDRRPGGRPAGRHAGQRRARRHRPRAAARRASAVGACPTPSSPPTPPTRRRWRSRC